MPRTLSEDHMNLIRCLPLDYIYDNLNLIFQMGERAAGTQSEFKAAVFIKEKFEEFGLENVHLEPFSVVKRDYKECRLRMLEPFCKEIPCVSAGTSVSTPSEGITSEVIDAGFGTLMDFEKLKKRGVETEGKIALIERSDRLTYWLDISSHLAKDFGIVAVIFTSFFPEHSAFRKEAFPFPTLPAIYIPYSEAQQLRRILKKERVKVNLLNIVDVDENGISYNVVGEIPGSEYPDDLIMITAHHDSWFGGANDDASGVATILGVAKLLSESYKPKKTIRFVSFGSEESGSRDFMEWCVGSYAYVNEKKDEIERVIVNINLDAFAYGDLIKAHTTPELKEFMENLAEDLGFERVVEVVNLPTSWTDQWSFAMCGVPSVDFSTLEYFYEKIYHTNLDAPENISYYLLEVGGKLALAAALSFDSREFLPYNFFETAKVLRECMGKASSSPIDLSSILEEITRFMVIAQEFNMLREKVSKREVPREIIGNVNKLQREVCHLLNRSIIGSGGEANKEATWIIEHYIVTLEKLHEAVKSLRSNDPESALRALQSLPTMRWGLNVSLDVYNRIFELMMRFSRYQTFYPNVMSEVISLKNKVQSKINSTSEELSSLERKYSMFREVVQNKISEVENVLSESSRKILETIFELFKFS